MNIFKQMEVVGFKSFADKISVTFDGGITAIVGPNGCGKSNVADSIRWVLGEQSAKVLRGKNMTDVIFVGTDKRKPLSFCEVSLIFDNSKRWFNIDVDELVFTRKLYRSGESEYCINRTPCRRKNIIELLYDSGIGKDGYSIIGQGKVDEILKSKPEDRRSIFEEAAGIAKYKAKKEETENSLERTRSNMALLNVKYHEVQNQVEPLRKQAEDAKTFLTLRDRLKELEINTYLYQFENTNKIKTEIKSKTSGLNENLAQKQSDLNILQIKYDQNMSEINKIDTTISELRDDVLHYTVTLEKKQGETNLLNERLQHLYERETIIKDQLNKSEMEYQQTEMLINGLKKKVSEENDNLLALRNKSNAISNKYLEIVDDITKNEVEAEESQRKIIENLTKLTDIKANMSSLIAKRDSLNENITANKEKLAEVTQNKANIENEINLLTADLSNLEQEKANAEKVVEDIKIQIQANKDETSELIEHIFAIKSSIANDTSRKTMLQNLQADYEGYQYSVKKLLQESKQNKTLSSAILGVVGNVLTTDEKYQTAIEVALGSSIQNIITADEANAKILINHLKENKLGRATFLPLNAVKVRTFNNADRVYLREKGCIGIATELLQYPAQFERAISSLLGNTVIVDTYDNAVNIARQSRYAFKIVTLDGSVLNPQGSISGGSRKNVEGSLLSKEQDIKHLTEKIEKDTQTLHTLTAKHNDLAVQYERLNDNYNAKIETVQQYNNTYYTLNNKLYNANEKYDEICFDLDILQKKIDTDSDFYAELQDKINSVDNIETDLSATQKQVNTSLNNRSTIFEDLKKKREEFNEQVKEIQTQIAVLEEKINLDNESIENYTDNLNSLRRQIEDTQIELDKQQSILSAAREMQENAEMTAENKELLEKLNVANEKLKSFDEFKSHLHAEIKEIDTNKLTLLDEISKLQNKIFQEESKLQKVDNDMYTMEQRILEDYELTYDDCLAYRLEDFDYKAGISELNKVKNQMTALGDVNMQAMEQYKSISERYEEMTAQMQDLDRTEQNLLTVIKDLSTEMLAKFNSEFEKINANFGVVFKELFNGGEARLELLDADDPLNAGVDIVAQPPSKKLQSITLLSGGEQALTAIALLFAILKLRPTPFVVLDEIEAALDDTNVERFAKYLRRFSERTQFIIITHKKQSMELADSIYGVTMEEKGVSKLVSVKLSDAIKNADTEKKE